MTYTDSGVYVVQTTSALEARKAIRPETLAIELDPRYCSVQPVRAAKSGVHA